MDAYQVAGCEVSSAGGRSDENAGQAHGQDDRLAAVERSIDLLILYRGFLQHTQSACQPAPGGVIVKIFCLIKFLRRGYGNARHNVEICTRFCRQAWVACLQLSFACSFSSFYAELIESDEACKTGNGMHRGSKCT